MNYQKIYDSLIERGRQRKRDPGVFYERHHIIPKSYGGSNSSSNLVSLTLKEHYIAHLLLTFIYPKCPKMWTALWNMCNLTPKNYNRYKPSSRIYNRLRSEYMSIWGNNHPSKGRTWTEEQRRNISNSLKKFYSTKPPKPIVIKVKKKRKAPPHLPPISYKAVLQFDTDGNLIQEWKGLRIAANALNINENSILQCIQRRSITAGEFVWYYKKDYKEGTFSLKQSLRKPVYQYSSDGVFIAEYPTVILASDQTGITKSNINQSLRTGWKAKSFYFKHQKTI